MALNWPRFEGVPTDANAVGDSIERMVARETEKAAREYRALQAKKAADAKQLREHDRHVLADAQALAARLRR